MSHQPFGCSGQTDQGLIDVAPRGVYDKIVRQEDKIASTEAPGDWEADRNSITYPCCRNPDHHSPVQSVFVMGSCGPVLVSDISTCQACQGNLADERRVCQVCWESGHVTCGRCCDYCQLHVCIICVHHCNTTATARDCELRNVTNQPKAYGIGCQDIAE